MMLLDAPESLTDYTISTDAEPETDVESSVESSAEGLAVDFDPPELETIPVSEANEELQEVANELQEAAAVQSNVNEDDRRFWAKIDVIGQITECQASIAESESTIDNYKCEIKEEKELLKGEQIRLQRLAAKLADIVSGKPLPVEPGKEKDGKKLGAGQVAIVDIQNDEQVDDMAWRNVETRELLKSMSGLGAKKLDALVELARTAGELEDLRGEASKAHKSFKELLPKGCGQTLADAIEDRLMDCVASGSKSAAEQLAEQNASQSDAEMLHIDLVPIVKDILNELQKDYEAGAAIDEYRPADPEDKNDWFVLGFDAFGEAKTLNDCPKHDDDFDRDWVMGWLSAQFIDEWDQHEPADKTSQNS